MAAKLTVVYSSVGCAHCMRILDVVKGLGAELVDVIKAPEKRIRGLTAKYGFLRTPTLIYKNKVLFSGETPSREQLLKAMR